MKKEYQGKIGQTHSFISSAKASYTEPDTALSRQVRLKTNEHIRHQILWVKRTNGNVLLHTNNTIYCRPYLITIMPYENTSHQIWQQFFVNCSATLLHQSEDCWSSCWLLCLVYIPNHVFAMYIYYKNKNESEFTKCYQCRALLVVDSNEEILFKLCTVSQLFLQMLM